jgi:hypothetical protein
VWLNANPPGQMAYPSRLAPPNGKFGSVDVDVILKQEIIDKLSHNGIMAYVAVSMAGNVEATTAVLAASVRVTSAVMLDGLKELAVEVPMLVGQAKKGRWHCGDYVDGNSIATLGPTPARYATFVDDLKKYWEHVNPDIPFSMDGKDGAAIRRWLAGHANWEQRDWRRALNNRSKSVVSRSAPFFTWIPKLSEHAAGPLNEYGRPQEGTGKKGAAINVEEANRSAREQVLGAANGRG